MWSEEHQMFWNRAMRREWRFRRLKLINGINTDKYYYWYKGKKR